MEFTNIQKKYVDRLLSLFTDIMTLNLKKKLVKHYVWSIALHR